MTRYRLKLYITGQTARAQMAVANLRRICEEALAGRCEVTIVDVLEHPQLAEDARILATPTLVKEAPFPVRRIIGDLSDRRQVLFALGLEDCVEQ